MILKERRRPFAKRSRLGRRPARLSDEPSMTSQRNERADRASKMISLAIILFLMGMLGYALFKFVEMIRLRGLDLWPLAFVPAAIVIVLFVLLRVVRSLVREIRVGRSFE